MRLALTTIAVLLVLAGPAPAADSGPVRLWSVSRIDQGAGAVVVKDGAQAGGKLEQYARVGRVVFNLPLHAPYWYFLPRDEAFGSVFSNASGAQYSVLAQAPTPNPLRLGAPKGAIAHLDEYRAYEKRSDHATLRITLSDLLLQTVDDNNGLGAWQCPDTGECEPLRAVVRFHARAYAASAGGDFYTAGGVAYLKGHQHSWQPGAWTTADSPGPLWGADDFDVDGDADDSGTGAAGVMSVNRAIRLKVPLGAVKPGELFGVHVELEAEAVDDRGGESAAQSFIQDPQQPGKGPLLSATGLKPRGKPRFKEPRAHGPAPARCPGGTPRRAGTLGFGDAGATVDESERTAMLVVRRTGGARGAASVTLTTRGGTARSGQDFERTTTTVRFGNGDSAPRLVEIPLREDAAVESRESFAVALEHGRCAKLGRRTATVTLVDDDQVPAPPLSLGDDIVFSVRGTVDGLRGSGLVLTDRGRDVAIAADGPFAFPGVRVAGESYDVEVKTQPHDPDQLCTVEHGTGIGPAPADVAVHCVTPPPASGLDATFGDGGRVSTPVGGLGHGEALVIQPDGGLVTAGWRTTPTGEDFALTRHDASGVLDQGFGDHGIVTTDLGGANDEANDAALTPGGGIVAVGSTNPDGAQKTDFGVARYTAAGGPIGFVRTDISGFGDVANAVAAQPGDGKIVVAGYATRNGIDGDFALVRYNADGTPDQDFGDHGIVTTDLGTRSDDARALVIQPDGRIVVAGSAGDDMALVRYTDRGLPDATFGAGGIRITDLGAESVANGVALAPGGEILAAGTTLGPQVNRDFLLARYSPGGTLEKTAKTDVLGGDDFAENLVVDAQGRAVVVGRATSSTILDLALVRYTADLAPDASFDGDGIVTADFHGRGEFGQDVALDQNGRIVAAGYTANGSDTQFALLRANP